MEANPTAEDREQKRFEKERESLEKALVDGDKLDTRITKVIQQIYETGRTVGWKPSLMTG